MSVEPTPVPAPGATAGETVTPTAPGGKPRRFVRQFGRWIDRQIPPELLTTPESARQAKLITRFGAMGCLFGLAYAGFYWSIHHFWGAVIVALCSGGMALTPPLMRWRKSVSAAGNFFSLTLTLGFTGLCLCEGGIRGHAIAWLVSVPLCALLLLGIKPASRWAVIAFSAAAIIAGFDLSGRVLPCTYDPQWNSVLSCAGYLGLILFMSILGLVFEIGRARAHAKMTQALAQLAQSNEKLVQLNTEKNEIMGIVAHDLKNPLTIIAYSAEMLALGSDPAKIKRISKTIGDASTRMQNLIRDLLDANAIEQGKFAPKKEYCDLNEAVAQCVENNRPSAAKKQITLSVGMCESAIACADLGFAMQILENLISNALKFSPPSTSIHIHTLPEKGFAAVTVRDEGPGISEADQAKLFKKFSRLTAQPTGGESSTGLGLSIVKRLAESMGGTVLCQSQLGAGAKFTLRLPVWRKEAKPPPAPQPPPLPEARAKSVAAPQMELPRRQNLPAVDSAKN